MRLASNLTLGISTVLMATLLSVGCSLYDPRKIDAQVEEYLQSELNSLSCTNFLVLEKLSHSPEAIDKTKTICLLHCSPLWGSHALERFRNVTTLEITYTSCVDSLIDDINAMPNLKELHCLYCMPTESWAQRLSNENLRVLRVSVFHPSQVPAEAIEHLKQTLPQCKVHIFVDKQGTSG